MTAHPTPWILKIKPVLIGGNMNHYTKEQNAYLADKVKKRPPEEWLKRMRDLNKLNLDKTVINLVLDNGENLDIAHNNLFKIYENNWHHFKGWKCNLGIDRFSIERNGDITGSCGNRLFNNPLSYSIYDPQLPAKFKSNLIKETTCFQDYCVCSTDIKINKHV
jgi:hypothetical protein